jgi:hypothetical protein
MYLVTDALVVLYSYHVDSPQSINVIAEFNSEEEAEDYAESCVLQDLEDISFDSYTCYR